MAFTLNLSNQLKAFSSRGDRKNYIFNDLVGNDDFYTYKQGINSVRFLPPWSEQGIIFKKMEVFRYMKPLEVSFCAPMEFGLWCPFAAASKEMFADKNWKAKYKEDLAKARPSVLYYSVIVTASDLNTPKLLQCGVKLKNQLVNILEQSGDISDPETGFLINITVTGEMLQTEYVAIPDRKSTSIMGSPALDHKYNLDKMFLSPPLELIYKSFMGLNFQNYTPSSSLLRELENQYGPNKENGEDDDRYYEMGPQAVLDTVKELNSSSLDSNVKETPNSEVKLEETDEALQVKIAEMRKKLTGL